MTKKYFFLVLHNGTHDTLAMVGDVSNTRQEIVVSFRGSANSWNLVHDFVFLMGHTGFYIATMSLYDVYDFKKTNG